MKTPKDEILSNPVVTGTLAALEQAGFPVPDLAANKQIDEFAAMDALDPMLVAMGTVSESERRAGKRLDRALLPQEVGEMMAVVDGMRDKRFGQFDGVHHLLLQDKPWADFLGVLTFIQGVDIMNASGVKGSEYDLKVFNTALFSLSVLSADAWKNVPPKIMDKYFQAIGSIADNASDAYLQLRLDRGAAALVAEVLKGSATPPPPKTAAPKKGNPLDL